MQKQVVNKKIAEINQIIIDNNDWIEFSIASYDGFKLEIIGSDDLSYYYTISIVLLDVQYISGYSSWHLDLDEQSISIMLYDLDNRPNDLPILWENYYYFQLVNTDLGYKPILIMAKDIEYTYEKRNLKNNN